MANPNNCSMCDHKRYPDGGWCYMFRNEPDRVCHCHTAHLGILDAAVVQQLGRTCRIPGCIEARGPDFNSRRPFGSLKCDYTGTPPFADAAWKDDPTMCKWCAGTGHPHGDERYGMCKCPALQRSE
jgi:hypothetical protein